MHLIRICVWYTVQLNEYDHRSVMCSVGQSLVPLCNALRAAGHYLPGNEAIKPAWTARVLEMKLMVSCCRVADGRWRPRNCHQWFTASHCDPWKLQQAVTGSMQSPAAAKSHAGAASHGDGAMGPKHTSEEAAALLAEAGTVAAAGKSPERLGHYRGGQKGGKVGAVTLDLTMSDSEECEPVRQHSAGWRASGPAKKRARAELGVRDQGVAASGKGAGQGSASGTGSGGRKRSRHGSSSASAGRFVQVVGLTDDD